MKHAPLQVSQTNRTAKRKYCILDQSEESIQSSRPLWEIRHRQGPSIKVDGTGKASATAIMVATEPRYLLGEHVKRIEGKNPGTNCRQTY